MDEAIREAQREKALRAALDLPDWMIAAFAHAYMNGLNHVCEGDPCRDCLTETAAELHALAGSDLWPFEESIVRGIRAALDRHPQLPPSAV